MRKLLRPLLLVAALLFSQHAAMLHGLAHAEHELTIATQHGGKAPTLGHGSDVCAAFGALAQALVAAAVGHTCTCIRADVQAASFDAVPAVTRVVFDSRAPPLST